MSPRSVVQRLLCNVRRRFLALQEMRRGSPNYWGCVGTWHEVACTRCPNRDTSPTRPTYCAIVENAFSEYEQPYDVAVRKEPREKGPYKSKLLRRLSNAKEEVGQSRQRPFWFGVSVVFFYRNLIRKTL